MTRVARLKAAAAAGYVVGMFPTADLVARRASGGTVDLRAAGSGNPGGANAIAVLGATAGVVVIVGDVAKGTLACALGGAIAGPAGAHLAGTAAVAGHCYPVTAGFRGGKGVAASVGQCLATFPAYFPIDLVVAVAAGAHPAVKQRAFTATAVSSVGWVLGGVVWTVKGWRNGWGPKPTALLPLAAAASSAMIIERFAHATRVGSGYTRRISHLGTLTEPTAPEARV
jgi:glycerol-3-phosphate acyltransferase PlsY